VGPACRWGHVAPRVPWAGWTLRCALN